MSQSQNSSLFKLIFFLISIGLGIVLSFISLFNEFEFFDWQNFLMFGVTWLKNPNMLSLSFLMFTIIVISSGIRFYILTNDHQKSITFWQSLRFGILARYYVLITPWGLGSQPILMGLMIQRGISIGKATSSVMLDLLLMRLSMSLIALVGLIFFGNLMNSTLLFLAWIGFGFTCLFPIIIVIGSLSKSIEMVILKLIKTIFPKRGQVWTFAISSSLLQYRIAFQNYQNKLYKLIIVFGLSIISQLALLSIPFFILNIFPDINVNNSGINFNYLNILMIMALANVVLGVVPTLGSAGAAEFTFSTVFSIFISGQFLVIAVFLWRFLLFYSWLILGVSFTVIEGFRGKKSNKQIRKPNFNLPLKVFLFNDGFFPLIDGVVRAVDAYARFLVDQGVDVTVVVPFKGDISKYPYKIVAIPQIKIPGFYYPIPFGLNRTKLIKLFCYEGPTIYHAHTPFLLGQLASKLAKRYNVPLITTFHSKYYDDFYAATKNKFISNVLKDLTIRFFSKSNAIWTVSKATVETIKTYGLVNREIKVIPNGSDIKVYTENKDELVKLSSTFGIRLEKKTILFVGQLIWQKNLKLILDTIQELDEINKTYQLIIVGEGRHENDIKKYARKLSIKTPIIFTGKISSFKTLSALYSFADLFFFPSAYDNDPLVIKEAAAHKLPSLVLKQTSVAKLINNNINGFIQGGDAHQFAKRILKILDETNDLQKIGLSAQRDLVTPWAETLKNLVQAYHDEIKKYHA